MPVWSFSTQPAGIGKFTIEFWNPEMSVWSLPAEFDPGAGWYIDPFPRIRVTWKPATGYTFKNWSIIGSTSTESMANPYVGTVTDPNGGSFSCWVTTPTQYTLTISVSPAGTGTTNPAPGTHQYPGGTILSILATPYSGYRFVRWDGTGSGLPTNPFPLTLWGNANLIAVFEPVATTYFVTFHMDNMRGVIYAAEVPRTDSDAALFTLGEAITIRAVAHTGYVFASWARTGGVSVASTTQQTTTMTGSGDGTLTANFNPAPVYTPTISVSPTTLKAGDQFTVTGSGFNPALPVDIFTTDLYGNNLQFPASQSPTPQGTLSLKITLNAAITYSGTGYVVAIQNGGRIRSNQVQISISGAVLPQHRYYTRYVRIDSATDIPIVTFYVRDLTANTFLSQDTLRPGIVGKIICFKGSADVYDSHHIRISVKNSGAKTIGLRYGLAYNENASNSGTNSALTPGSESAAVDIGTWSIFKNTDFDFSGCEGTGPIDGGVNCEEKFPNRGLFAWDMVAYGFCLAGNAIQSGINAIATGIGNILKPLIDPFLQPWLNFVTMVTGIGTAVSLWIKDPWSELQKVVDATWAIFWSTFQTWANGATALWAVISKPIVDALAKIKLELPDWLGGFQTWLENLPDLVSGGLEWVRNPAKKLAETAIAMVAEESPSAFVSMANILKTGYAQVPPKTPDWKLAPVTLWVEKTVHEWVQKWRARIIELAEENADDPATFSRKLTDEILYLETDAIATGMDLEMASLGLLEGGARVIDIVLNYIGGGPITHIHDQTAIAESIAITSQQYWANKFRKHLPGTGDIINQVVKEIIELDEFKRLMGLQGFSETHAQRIWDAHFIAPARQELVTALRRGKITPEAWERLKILVDLDPRYDKIDTATGEAGKGTFSLWDEMVYDDPGLSNLRFMYESGSVLDEQLPDYLKALGYRPEHIPALETYIKEYQSRFFRRRQLTLIARMVKAGKITEDEFIARAKAIYYTEKTARYELENQALASELSEGAAERIAQLGSINSWYTEDIIDAATYRDSAHTLLYSDDFIDKQLTYLDKKKAPTEPPVTEREATRAMYDTYYVEDIIDSIAWRAFYVAQKYPTDVIELQLALLDKKKAPPVEPPPPDLETERDLLQSEALAAYKKHIIDETTLRDRLDKLGRSDDAINVLVALAKMEMATEQRDATLGVYAKAYRQGAILRSDYLAKLIDNQYMPDAAELIVQTEELSWGTGVEALTAEQILNAWEQGFQTIEQTTDRLRKAGWTDSDMRIRLSFSVIDMLKAKHITAAEADVLWTQFGQGPEERARLAAWYGGTPA